MAFRSASILSSLCLAASILQACSSATRNPAEAEQSGPLQRYEEIKSAINQRLDAAVFHPGDPMVVDEMSTPEYKIEFARENCGFAPDRDHVSAEDFYRCDHLFQQTLLNRIAKKYFAADRSSIELKCAQEPLVCGDPGALEYMVRRSHDSAIEELRASKLEPLEKWRQGKISEEELPEDLREELNRTP